MIKPAPTKVADMTETTMAAKVGKGSVGKGDDGDGEGDAVGEGDREGVGLGLGEGDGEGGGGKEGVGCRIGKLRFVQSGSWIDAVEMS
jgi:hypothetical protein